MFIPFPQRFISPQFMFLVGDDKTPVSFHAAVMASLSEPFDRLVYGPMREAQEKCAELPDIELDIFLLLVDFTYTQDYTVKPRPDDSIKNQQGNLKAMEHLERDLHDEKDILHLCLPDEQALTNTTLKTQWRQREYMSSSREFGARYPKSVDFGKHLPHWSHEANYLVHAKLYSLGERYIIPHLKVMAMSKLHTTLDSCDSIGYLHQNRQDPQIPAAISLIAYAYSNDNTPDRGDDGRLDLLRKEVLEFAVISMAHLQSNSDFTRLVANNEQLAMDIVRLMQGPKLRSTMTMVIMTMMKMTCRRAETEAGQGPRTTAVADRCIYARLVSSRIHSLDRGTKQTF